MPSNATFSASVPICWGWVSRWKEWDGAASMELREVESRPARVRWSWTGERTDGACALC